SENGEPIAGQKVRAAARVEGKRSILGAAFLNHFEVQRLEARTDEGGNFTFQGLATNLKVRAWTVADDDSTQERYLEEILRQPNESRPREVYRLKRNSDEQKKRPLAKRLRATLRDCALSGYRAIVIVADWAPSSTAFVDTHFRNYETNPDVYSFIPIVISGNGKELESDDLTFLKDKNWQSPSEDRIFVYALDSQGNSLGQLEIKVNDKDAAPAIANFIHRHAPTKIDAEKKWDEAFAEAKRSNRRVWARVSQRYC